MSQEYLCDKTCCKKVSFTSIPKPVSVENTSRFREVEGKLTIGVFSNKDTPTEIHSENFLHLLHFIRFRLSSSHVPFLCTGANELCRKIVY